MSFQAFLKKLRNKDSKESSSDRYQEKRRNNRIDVVDNEQLKVHLLYPGEGDSATTLVTFVRNVSLRGCSVKFETKDERRRVKIGDRYIASLMIEGFSIPLSVNAVRFIGDEEVGLQFNAPYPKELRYLERYLEPRFIGQTLREIKSESLKAEKDFKLRWFQGENDSHLFCWVSKSGQVVHIQIIFLNQVVDWDDASHLKTGRMRPETTQGSVMGWVQSELLDFDPEPNRVLVKQARALVTVSEIDPNVKEVFMSKIK